MTVSNSNNRTRLAYSGLTYDFTFKIDDDSEILVYSITAAGVATLKTLTTDYTVSISTITEGGTVTLTGAISGAAEILMVRDKDYAQAADIPVRGGFNESIIEGALDSLEMQIQQVKELIDYCVKQSSTVVPVTVTIPAPEAGMALVWDDAEDGTLINGPVDAAAVAGAVADAEASAAAALASETAAGVSQAAAAASAVTAASFFPAFVDRGDPAAVDKAIGDFTTDATWRDLDLSSIVPDGAKAIALQVAVRNNTQPNGVQFRKKGNSNTINVSYVRISVNDVIVNQDVIVPCSTARVIQYNADNVTWTTLNVTVKGYFK